MALDKMIAMPRTLKEIKKRLKETNKRQADLAEAAKISPSAVSQLLNGHTAISKQHILSFSSVLGGSPEFWQKLFDKDMDDEQQEKEERVRIRFKDASGNLVEVPHADNYLDDPEAAGRYMASLIIGLQKAGYKPAP